MRLIHLGTKIVSEFGIVDDAGCVIDEVAIMPDPANKQDPLFIRLLNAASFEKAMNAVFTMRQELEKKIDEQIADAKSKTAQSIETTYEKPHFSLEESEDDSNTVSER